MVVMQFDETVEMCIGSEKLSLGSQLSDQPGVLHNWSPLNKASRCCAHDEVLLDCVRG